MAVLISPSELASESASSAVLDGAGVDGDSIGITDTHFITTAGTTPAATRFTTAAISIGAVVSVAALSAIAVGRASAEATGPLTATTALLGDTLHLAVKAVSAPALSAVTTAVDRQEAFPRAEAPASAVAEGRVASAAVAVAAGIGNRNVPGRL